jgi:hypothetical protein
LFVYDSYLAILNEGMEPLWRARQELYQSK